MTRIVIKLTPSLVVPSLLLAFAVAAMVVCTVVWFVVMTRISAAPAKPTPEHTVPYNRHGQTVFITPFDEDVRTWLPVAGGILGPAVFGFGFWARFAWAKQQAQK